MWFGLIGAFAVGPSSYCNSLIATRLSNHIFLADKLKEELLMDDYKHITLSSWQQDWASCSNLGLPYMHMLYVKHIADA